MKYWNKICFVLCLSLGALIWQRNMLGPFLVRDGSDLRTFLGLIAQISATMLGFLLAALAILASISGHRLVRNMQKTGHYRVLLKKVFFDVVAFGVATALALIAYLTKSSLGTMALLSILSFFYASLVLIDVGMRFWIVLTTLNPDPT